MIGYAQEEVFSGDEQTALDHARILVAYLPAKIFGDWVRCHELARVVLVKLRTELHMTVVDGKCGPADHSWIILGRDDAHPRAILDVYAVGRLPQVQLVDATWLGEYGNYKPGPYRDDIRHDVITELGRRL